MYEFLAEYNKASVDQVKQICDQITANAKQAGLKYNLDIAKPANSMRAHILSHAAKKFNLQNEIKEAVFKAHFTDGKNIDDVNLLTQLAISAGMDSSVAKEAFTNKVYADAVKADIIEAQQKGLKGVPYYLFNSTYSLQGAQQSDNYKTMLEKSYAELKKENSGSSCEIGGKC
jgi:predicted DsbA family dithiol-disulfide isomerase